MTYRTIRELWDEGIPIVPTGYELLTPLDACPMGAPGHECGRRWGDHQVSDSLDHPRTVTGIRCPDFLCPCDGTNDVIKNKLAWAREAWSGRRRIKLRDLVR